MTDDPGTRLREILQQEADSIRPAGDGLTRIQDRVAARRARARWLRPALALGAAAVLAGAAVGVVSLTRGGDDKQSIGVATQPPATSSETPTSPPATTTTFPANVVWPFSSAAEASAGDESWHTDALATAQHFVNDYLGMAALDKITKQTVNADTADVSLGRRLPSESKALMTATTVHLIRWSGGDRPWLVAGASDDDLKISAPAAGSSVSSPLTVTGPGFGVDESLSVVVRSTHGSSPLGAGHTAAGNGNPWSVSIGFAAPTETTGMLVANTASAIDGAPARVAVVPVRLGGSGATSASYPSTFVGIKDSRVAVFSSRDGAALRWLTDAQPGGGASDPQVNDDQKWVYYLQAAGTCANALMRVPYAGGTSEQVLKVKDAVISGYGTSGTRLAYVTQACTGGAQTLVARDTSTGATHTLSSPAPPPGWVGDPAWSPDGTQVAAIVQYGMSRGVRVYDIWRATAVLDGTEHCVSAGHAVLPQSLLYRPDGSLLLYGDTGDSATVSRCTGQSPPTQLFTVPSGQPADVSLSSGGAVLVTSLDGKVWRWTSGELTELHPAKPVTDARW